jgi:hypothetical protein
MKLILRTAKFQQAQYVVLCSILLTLAFFFIVSQAATYKHRVTDSLDRVIIPADGTIVESDLTLASHVRYSIIVTGTYRYDVGESGEFADAQYREDDNDQWTIRWNSVEFDGIRLAAGFFDLEHHMYTM